MVLPIPTQDRHRPTVSDSSLETFARSVQPLLLNTCTTSGCHTRHQPGPMRLTRGSRTRGVDRHATLRNLEAVLLWVDRDHPMESRLLRAATTPHGTARVAPLTGAHRDGLIAWLEQFSPQPAPTGGQAPLGHHVDDVRRPAGNASSKTLFPPGKIRRGLQVARRAPANQASGDALDRTDSDNAAGAARVADQRQSNETSQATEQEKNPSLRDPFDPADFTRRSRPGAACGVRCRRLQRPCTGMKGYA